MRINKAIPVVNGAHCFVVIDLRTCILIRGSRATWPALWDTQLWWSQLTFHQKESVERISETPVRSETNQARHRLAFPALCQWSDRATLGEIAPLRRGFCAGKKTVVEVGEVTRAFRAYTGKKFRPLEHLTGLVNLPTNDFL